VAAGERKAPAINGELWHACAGPLVSLPPVGSLVVYFPQGHSEQVSVHRVPFLHLMVPFFSDSLLPFFGILKIDSLLYQKNRVKVWLFN
jgi:hypothetical protein